VKNWKELLIFFGAAVAMGIAIAITQILQMP
jgi:hypothetical protein